MTKTKPHIWLQDKVVYPPTREIVGFWDNEKVILDDTESPILIQSIADYLSEYNPHPIGTEVERECPTCGGIGCLIGTVPMVNVETGDAVDFPVFKDGSFERHPCLSLCTDGTQKRRIVDVTLVEHTDFACTLESADDVDRVLSLVLDGYKYLIVADTERAKVKTKENVQ